MNYRKNNFFSKANIPIWLGMFALSFWVGCGDTFDFEKTYTIDEGGWEYEDAFDYNLTIQDTTVIYNIYLELSHSDTYANQNLYVQIHTKFPSGELLKEQISLELADKTGKWNGNCSGKQCTVRIPIQQGAFFNQAGQYTFTVEQFMRKNPLQGVHSVALLLEDTQQKR